jgi:hypothetical protein
LRGCACSLKADEGAAIHVLEFCSIPAVVLALPDSSFHITGIAPQKPSPNARVLALPHSVLE